MANDLFYYLKRVMLRGGGNVPTSFPSAPSNEQQVALDAINMTLRLLNAKYFHLFKLTEYALTTTSGVYRYNLTESPYSQTFFRASNIARNGIIRNADGVGLMPKDYVEIDRLRIASASTTVYGPQAYAVFGKELWFYPTPEGQSLTIRYYGSHIGTDAAGTTLKQRLTLADDLTMLEDEWEDVLVTGAAKEFRAWKANDERYKELCKEFEQYTMMLNDRANQGGEDNPPEIAMVPYRYSGHNRRIYPFGTDQP